MMNDDTGKAGAVLLPAAKVALHVKDAEIKDAAKALMQDWRFARISFEISDGSIETAIDIYQTQASPDLVIVETSTIEDGFTQRLEVLAGNCSANTSAVVVGPVNDVYLYRKLIDMGVSDYLVRPVTKDVLAQVIAKNLIEKFGTPESRLLAFVGAKGGVGTSTIAQSVAHATAARLGEKTIILDAAGGWSYLAVGMGTDPMTSFQELARLAASPDEAAFRRMIYPIGDKLSVLATGSDAMLDDHITADAYEALINRLMVIYPILVVDLSGAPSPIKKSVMARAHQITVVSTPTLPSLRAARTLMQEIKNLRGDSGDHINLIINKIGETGSFEVGKGDIEKAMEHKPKLSVDYDEKIFAASETQGKALHETKGAEKIFETLLTFVRGMLNAKEVAVSDGKGNDPSLLHGLFSKLKKKA